MSGTKEHGPVVANEQGTTGRSEPLGFAALLVAICALAVSVFAAYQSRLSAVSAVATARPIVELSAGPGEVAGSDLVVPVRLVNSGKTTADIRYVRLVYWADKQGAYRYYEYAALESILVRAGGTSQESSIRVARMQRVDGEEVDLAKGCDQLGRLQFRVRYASREMDGQEFEESTGVPIRWH